MQVVLRCPRACPNIRGVEARSVSDTVQAELARVRSASPSIAAVKASSVPSGLYAGCEASQSPSVSCRSEAGGQIELEQVRPNAAPDTGSVDLVVEALRHQEA